MVAAKAVKAGIALAKEMGARITGYSAYEPVAARLNVSSVYFLDPSVRATIERYARNAATKNVARIGRLARKAGVSFELGVGKADHPADGIIETARKRHCDAIFLASHGSGSIATLLLGSVTQKVLARSKIPVLVFR